MYIQKLISQGEHETLEFKFEVNDPRKIARTLVAFANTKGGHLLVGVKDNGVITGVSTEEEYYMVESGAKLYSFPEIDFTTRVHNSNGKQVLEFIIEPSANKPHAVIATDKTKETYIRVKDENVVAHPLWVKAHQQMKHENNIKYTNKHNELLSILSKKGAQTIEFIMKELFISQKETEKILTELFITSLINIITTTSGTVFSSKNSN